MNFQPPQIELIDISEWGTEEEDLLETYPRGTLDKSRYRYKNHHYLFKHAWTRRKEGYNDEILHQIWVELIAAYIAHQLEVEVPATFLAVNHNGPFQYGVLSKWFIGPDEDFQLGADFLQSKLGAYDEKSAHNLHNILHYSEDAGVPDSKHYWAKVLLFDCLIGNTDRHHENWGIIESQGAKHFAPAFDNGIALGFRAPDQKLSGFDHAKFLRGFRHKIPLHSQGAPPGMDALLDFIKTLGLNHLEFINRLDIDELASIVCKSQAGMDAQLEEPYRLSEPRGAFIVDFVRHRKNHIARYLDA